MHRHKLDFFIPKPTGNRQPPITHYSLPTTHYSLPTTHYPLPTTHYPLPTTHYSPLLRKKTAYCRLFITQ
ncbi:MAG: hypothetical protein LBG72_02750 [Spirochaetaceae bacterium]|nr:hypothetical protein [Spirochaetaceae bacterium]